MTVFEGLMYGLGVALTPENLLAALLGVLAGTIIGIVPGLGPIAGAAILLPLTFHMSPVAGVIMIAGIYYGVMYGGSTTAVLLNIPGEAPSVVAAFDGYEMTKQGRAGPALGIIAIGSFVSGTIAVILVSIFLPRLSRTALMFGSGEFFALTAGGLLILSRIMGGRLSSGLLPMMLGVLLGTVGEEAVTGSHRFTFGILEISAGIGLVPVAIGMFGLAELMVMSEKISKQPTVQSLRFKDLLPGKSDLKRALPSWGRGGLLGFTMGLLPGPSATMSTFMAWRVEKAVSKNRHEVGKGAIEGVAGPEAANNAAATASMIPVLALGIPFSGTLALMLAALISQGITPGPLLVVQHPDVFWGVIASMYIGNLMLLVINLPLIRIFVAMLRVPAHILVPVIAVIAVMGAFAANGRMFDLYVALGLGLIGYAYKKLDFQLAPLLVGVILGPLMEKYLREGLRVSGGDVGYFLQGAINKTIWAAVAVAFLWPIARLVVMHRRTPSSQMSIDG